MTVPLVLDDACVVTPEGRTILGPLSWRVDEGEHWALLGPNGAGKTTLLMLAGGQRHPTRGTVDVLGQRLGRVDLRTLRRRIGIVSVAVADRLEPSLGVLDAVLTGRTAALASWWDTFSDADRGRAAELLGRFGCGDLAGRRLITCSQGERQRVLLARALMGDAGLLLLDEPAVGLDLPGREAWVAALEAVAHEPSTPPSVLVTHHLEELPATTTHALLLRAAAPVAAGPVDEVLRDEPVSACFGLPVTVGRRERRWWAHARPSW